MRRPYVEPGHRSARPGIRHRSRSNGPDRKGRSPATLGGRTRNVSDTDSHTASDLDDEAFYSDEDQGLTDENAITAAEDIDDEDDEDDDDVSERPRPSSRAAARQLPVEDEEVRTPRNRSRTSLGASTPRTRPRAYSRSNKLAPEEEEWALKQEQQTRQKGGVLGRLKRLARKPKANNPPARNTEEGYNADAILGRSFGAERELRSRKSATLRDSAVSSQNSFRKRNSIQGSAAATNSAYSGSARISQPRSSGFDDDFDGEVARSPRQIRQRMRGAPSTIDSADESDVTAPRATAVSDLPPQIAMPVALREAERARSPQLIDPYESEDAVVPPVTDIRPKSQVESVRPSLLDTDDAISAARSGSPLIPVSGPLSHIDAIVPSQRPSMQSVRDAEIDQQNMSRSRKPSLDLRAAAGGALGGLAAMIGLDTLKETKTGIPPKEPFNLSLPAVQPESVSGDTIRNESVQSEKSITPPALLPRRTKKTTAPVVEAPVIPAAVEDVPSPVAASERSELPYSTVEAQLSRSRSLRSDADLATGADSLKPTRSRTKRNGAVAAAVGAGVGGLGGAALLSDDSERPEPIRTAASSEQIRTKPKRNGAAAAALGAGVGALGGAALLSDGSERPETVRNAESNQDNFTPLVVNGGSRALVTEQPVRTASLVRNDARASAIGTEPVLMRDYANESIAPPSLYEDEDRLDENRMPSRNSAALGAAAAVVRQKSKKQKQVRGSRVLQTLPALDEDHSVNHQYLAPQKQRGYLLTPSVAPSVGDPIDAGRVAPGHSKGEWLTKDLSPQQTQYFLQELATRELKWELDRAWLLTSFEKPVRTKTRKVRRDYSDIEADSRINDFAESSDEDLLDMDEDEDEEAVFRRGTLRFGQMYTQTTIPDLPLLRFLFKNAFATFPLFVVPEDKLDAYIGGPPDKATLARNYFFTGVLPFLRAFQSRALSATVDRHGEGDGTPFGSCSTTGALRNLLLQQAAKYVTAILRVGPADPYYDDEETLSKNSWPWPRADLLPPEAYFAYRKPLDRLKHGGYDVDVVGIRTRSATSRDYIIRLRRPRRPDAFVMRNDADFEEFRRNLSKDLSPFAFVKPLPNTRGRSDEGESDIEDYSDDSERSNFNAAGMGSANQHDRRNEPRAGDSRQMRGGGRDGRRRYSSGVQNGRPTLGRNNSDRYEDEDSFGDEVSDSDNLSDGTERPEERRQGNTNGNERSNPALAKRKSLKDLLPFNKPSGKRDSRDSRDNRPVERSNSRPQRRDTAIRNGPPQRDSLRRTNSGDRDAPIKFDARRQKLRNWLRDTLSIREAGHATEAQSFLTVGSYPERDLKRSDHQDMDERNRIDKHRRKEHARDADEAGKDVLELRDVCDNIWLECVDGDGFLRMYDALRDSPTYARLPLRYQKMVAWSNLQTARWLYGVFVSGDESRANLARAQDVYETVPWKKLAFAMKMPASQMLRSWQDQMLKRGFLQAILHVMLEDEPETIEEDLDELREAIGSEVMYQRLRIFVDSPGDLKRLIRQHAVRAEVPLVAAIVRGSEQPKLNKTEVQRVMDATDSYQRFMQTTPSVTKKLANKEPGYMLITNLQRAVRLLSLQRDGAQVRGMLQDPDIADALTALFEPLTEELRRLHRIKGMSNAVMDLQSFLGQLLDHLGSLRARVIDPMHAISTIAELLDDAALSWYPFLHRADAATPSVFSFFAWFRHLAMTVGNGSEDLAEIWTNPPPAPAGEEADNEDGMSVDPQDQQGALDSSTMRDINSLAEAARRRRNRDMEVACRWAAGDTEEHHSIRVAGDGQGKTRKDPYLPREPRPARPTPGLERFRASFREAVSSALGR